MRTRLGLVLAAALALGACGKSGPPVAPETRLPRPVTDLTAVVQDGATELAWTNPTRRADGSRLRDLALARVFRSEDSGAGEPKPALLSRGRVSGYTEIATVRLDLPPEARPAAPSPDTPVAHGERGQLTDRQGLAYGRRYTYVVIAEDSTGRASPPGSRVSLTFVAAPEAPSGLRAVAGEREVRLAWNPPGRLVDGSVASGLHYEVLRAGTPDAVPEPVTPAPIQATELTDRNLENERTYAYVVRAVRREGTTLARSQVSARVNAMPVDMTPPAAPTDLVAVPATGSVRLSWRASPDADVAAYIIYRAAPGGALVRMGSVRAPATAFVDREVPSGTWRYAVSAQDTSSRANESPRSSEVAVTLP